ncbi:MAG: Flp pilus assembly complex ATPase component TadA [Candidatus Parvarchaeota archaeon]|nr:Flp pilus assembly complex ATPase component TadA [Candidatus Parvarchaeota archaeon]
METKPKYYTITREEGEITLTYKVPLDVLYPNPEDNEDIFEKVVNAIIESGSITSLVIVSDRNYVYVKDSVDILDDIATGYKNILQSDISKPFDTETQRALPDEISAFNYVLFDRLKRDPVGAYVFGVRSLRELKVKYRASPSSTLDTFIERMDSLMEKIGSLKIIQKSMAFVLGYKIGDRTPYKAIFKPLIRPNFTYTRIMSEPPLSAVEVESYKLNDSEGTDVTIYRMPGVSQYLYHMAPPELLLNVDEYDILDQVRTALIDYKPQEGEFTDPLRMREIFHNIASDMISDISSKQNYKLSFNDIEKLASILVRLTVGFGMTEVILSDSKVEDVYINAPVSKSPIFVKHAVYGECATNIIPNAKEVDAWASRFRLLSGRPLDEGHPVLDTELITKNIRSRVAITQRPLSPNGLSIAFRRHREAPWTMPLFVNNKMISPFAAGLIWFCVEGARSVLINGTRGAGKTSLLTALMLMMMKKYRIITVEDTLEIPTDVFTDIGYDVLSMKVQSAIIGEKAEMSAEEGIRTTLRLGDSALIVGEVRSTEARALYEAMRVGALSNVVMGTIHGEDPYGVFDRVVNDLGVPRTSFKATDLIVSVNKIKSIDRLTEKRRVLSITEVRKDWTDDPKYENGFVDLVRYDIDKDMLVPTSDMLEGNSYIVKEIASKVEGWAGNWDAVLDNIQARGEILKMLSDYSDKTGDRDILEAESASEAVDQYYEIVNKLNEELGRPPDGKRIIRAFELWLKARKQK